MIVLLPPSETKRDGGDASTSLDWSQLSFSELTPQRSALASSLMALSRDEQSARLALGLSEKQLFEVERNRQLLHAPVLPAIERYTGVLYDGLDAASLSDAERSFAHSTVVVHSALFGPVAAGDPIPAYRLSHNSRVPGMPLKAHWRSKVTEVLASNPGLQIDLRSEAYAQLGAAAPDSVYLRVVTESKSGRKVALSHFNKKSKGLFARALISSQTAHATAGSLLDWARSAGFRLEHGEPGELDLVVDAL